MTRKEAQAVLEITGQADSRTIKSSFRKLMARHHPDAAGSESPEVLRRAQLINEAYSTLRGTSEAGQTAFTEKKAARKEKTAWKGKTAEHAFTERTIYRAFSPWEGAGPIYEEAARGKYEWDPDLEDFGCLLKSMNEAAAELLEEAERRSRGGWGDERRGVGRKEDEQKEDERRRARQREGERREAGRKEDEHRREGGREGRFLCQAELFHLLAGQFIRPVYCLEKLAVPEAGNEPGGYTCSAVREKAPARIYKFRGFLGAKGSDRTWGAVTGVKKGDELKAASLVNNRLAVSDGKGSPLGHLSLAEDQWYYIVIPILQRRLAQVKLVAEHIEIEKNRRPRRARVHVNLYLRIEKIEELREDADLEGNTERNRRIRQVLDQYEAYIRRD